MTDVIVLVVAADDGVKPQTKEALQLAQASGCPIVVALTKCDRPGADPRKAKQQLAQEGLELEDFGGTVQVAAPKPIHDQLCIIIHYSRIMLMLGPSMGQCSCPMCLMSTH